jgi:hypothetical protein
MLEQRLPIYRYKRRILDTVKRTAVTLLMAETGAGKSTQVVQYLHHHLFQVRYLPARENWRDSLLIRIRVDIQVHSLWWPDPR